MPDMASAAMDPITLEVFHEALVSTVAEMRVTVLRTAFSSIIYEGQDFSCALMDAQGRLVVQSREDNPAHVGPLNIQVPAALRQFEGDLHPGDVIIANDPFMAGTHLNDVAVMLPFFVDGKLLLVACTRAHWGDIGGMTPGSISGRTTEIFQEGVRIPIIKIYDRGKPNQALIDLLFANVRQPDDRKGDFMAQLATARTAEERLGPIVQRFGAPAVEAGMRQILDRTEVRMRRQIRTLPPGEYIFEDYLDSDGNSPEPVRLRVKVGAEADRAHERALSRAEGGSAWLERLLCDPEGNPLGRGGAPIHQLDAVGRVGGADRPRQGLLLDGHAGRSRIAARRQGGDGLRSPRRADEAPQMGQLPEEPAGLDGSLDRVQSRLNQVT
jgi:N-methylhydantoinase B